MSNFTNITHNETFYGSYNLWTKIIFSFFMFPIIFFSISGNILVIVAICKFSYLRITNNIFLASLAVADCAVGILAMPPNALQLITGRWYLKTFMCRFWLSSDVLFSTASILHLCCVSIDRYLSISDKYAMNYMNEHPLKSWRVRIMIASVWITSALLSFVPIYTNIYTTNEQANRIDMLDHENGQCLMIVNFPYRYVSSFVSFWLPGIGMITFYGLVMKKAYILEKGEFYKYKSVYSQIRNSQTNEKKYNDSIERKNKRNSSNITNEASGLTNSLTALRREGRNSSDALVRGWKREYKALKTLGTVIVLFCLCWVFFFLKYTICEESFDICPNFIAKNVYLEDILFWIGYFNSMLNPFLYNFTNQDFRRAFRSLLNIKHKSSNRSGSFESTHRSNLRKTTTDDIRHPK